VRHHAPAPVTLASHKDSLRASVRAAVAAVPPEQARAEALAVAAHVDAWLSSLAPATRPVAFYASVGGELDTGPLDAVLRAHGRPRAVPAIHGKTLIFRQVPDDYPAQSLPAGRFGIPTPPDAYPPVSPEDCAAILVPGVAFDTLGHRLGRGGGFYDRLLRSMPRELTVGLLLRVQLLPDVPVAEHDVRVGAICDADGLRSVP